MLSESPLTFISTIILRGAIAFQSNLKFFCGHPVIISQQTKINILSTLKFKKGGNNLQAKREDGWSVKFSLIFQIITLFPTVFPRGIPIFFTNKFLDMINHSSMLTVLD